ncbi:pectin lyase fold/virulence factor [Mrakia frigida]|uniref:pectin lyase fold/virulence factor n=1 Tax=Mrakia frigida TaxID=29902 RepID=UPI003FCC26CB
MMLRLLLTLLSLPIFALALSAPPSGALIVRGTGTKTGEYSTISKAVAAAGTGSDAKAIFVYFHGFPLSPSKRKPSLTFALLSVYITRSGSLKIYGETNTPLDYTKNTVTLQYGATLTSAGSDDASGTLRVHKDNFALYNVNVKNTHGSGVQAIAVSAYGSKQGYYACQLTGYQDTLLAQTGTQFYGSSLVAGAVDYVFGQYGQAFFYKSTIASSGVGSITASGRFSADSSYYVFDSCYITSTSSSTGTSVYLGRPWGDYARVVFQYSSLGAHINPAHWSVWSSSDTRTGHVTFGEYSNTGAGASTTSLASFATKLSSAVSATTVLGSDYKTWVDASFL